MLSKYTTEELRKELEHRERHPEWCIRELITEGYDLDNDPGFEAGTAWMDDSYYSNPLRFEE